MKYLQITRNICLLTLSPLKLCRCLICCLNGLVTSGCVSLAYLIVNYTAAASSSSIQITEIGLGLTQLHITIFSLFY